MSDRTRGRPPRISQDQIVAAARRVATRDLTMQAVADALGVSRKALHYYVGDREGLLTLVVLDQFERELDRVELPVDDDWRKVLRAYAVAFRDGLIQVGTATDFTRLRGLSASAALALADRVLDALLAAGLDPEAARCGLTAASNIAQSAAHTVVAQTASGVHRHRAQTTAALKNEPQNTYPALRRVLATAEPKRHDADIQFTFELNSVIAGLERILAARPAVSE
ncbi:TetR/AcrR family transcriptional regulator [Mycobacterium deserti]|uniref:TetR/AcrR family transcriptional regulator C-terminal domain-containing protein n=1 Tax=Mycobacterium deserti TaxID=2978347 RepID=A0ABT2ML22_9MYCO|nr:TetR/AcrR family transcriptional regulator C-terminal domain-containing protein [Mycobacterium deserti]MCT7661666.1 TetR/AcrR family transcriptional regulator C-terminal domain-containing protein [Mycobacterium deserti]